MSTAPQVEGLWGLGRVRGSGLTDEKRGGPPAEVARLAPTGTDALGQGHPARPHPGRVEPLGPWRAGSLTVLRPKLGTLRGVGPRAPGTAAAGARAPRRPATPRAPPISLAHACAGGVRRGAWRRARVRAGCDRTRPARGCAPEPPRTRPAEVLRPRRAITAYVEPAPLGRRRRDRCAHLRTSRPAPR